MASLPPQLNNKRIVVRKNSAGSDFIERRLNLIEGSGVTLTVTDAPSTNEVNVTIAAPQVGTVTSVAVATANGLAGTSDGNPSTPTLTLSTSINSPVLAGNGTAISAATTTGSGSTVVLQNTPTLTTPVIGAATGTSVVLTGNSTFAGYIRVGSNSAPANTTAGDLTASRLNLGNASFSSTESAIQVSGTMTTTASGAVAYTNYAPALTPASNSAANFRTLQFQGVLNPATTIQFTNIIEGGHFEFRVRSDGLINQITGIKTIPVIVDSSSAATASLTTIIGYVSTPFNRASGTTTTTVTTIVAYDADFSNASVGLTCTSAIGYRFLNPASGNTYTTAIGMDISGITVGSTNIGIRIAAPSGGATANYALQLSDAGGTATGGITFGTDTTLYRITANVLATDNSMRMGTYLRVGSTSAPANTTAGDLTATRLNIGNVAFNNSESPFQVSGTITTTASQASIWAGFSPTIAPTSNSATNFRTLQFQSLIASATTITISSVRAGYFENRNRQDGLVTTMIGLDSNPFVIDSASASTASATNVTSFNSSLFGRPSGTTTATVTTMIGFDNVAVTNAGLTATTFIGFRAQTPTAGTYTTLIGTDMQKMDLGTTTNIGVRIAQPGLAAGIGTTTDSISLRITTASVTLSDQTATTTNVHGISVGVITYTSTTNTRTVTNMASMYIAGAPVASTNVTVSANGGPYALWVDANASRFDGNLDFSVADATNVILGTGTGTQWGTGNTQKQGWWGATPVVRAASAALTNNVTAGGTTNVVDNVVAANVDTTASSLTTTRNAIYQLTLKLKEISDALRTYGIFT